MTAAVDTVSLVSRAVTIGSILLLVGALPISVLVQRALGGAGRSNAGNALALGRLGRVLRWAAVAVAGSAVVSLWRLAELFGTVDPEASAAVLWWDALRSSVGGWTAVRVPVAVLLWSTIPAALVTGSMSRRITWAAGVAILALSLSMTGHAAVTGATGIAVDVLHLTSGAVWLAGVAALAVVVPIAVRSGNTGRRRAVLLSCAVSFSRLAVPAVAVIAVTGVAHGLSAGGPSALTGSAWGVAATLKVLLMVGVLVAGLANHRVLIRRLAQSTSRMRVDSGSAALFSLVSLEVVLGVAMVFAAAVLVSVPKP